MNRLNLDVPKTVANLTREEYNDLVLWFFERSTRQLNLMGDLFDSTLTPEVAKEKRDEIATITKLVADRFKEEVGTDLAAMFNIASDLLKYKMANPEMSRLTPQQALILSKTGAAQELLRGLCP